MSIPITDLWIATQLPNATPISDAEKFTLIKKYRDTLLLNCAWVQLPDAVLAPDEFAAWQTYREALQVLEFSNANPDLIVIPDAPPDPTVTPPTPAQLNARTRRKNARTLAKNIPNWSTWTTPEWQTYFDANLSDTQADLVTSFPTARVMIKRQNLVIQNLVKLVIALRDMGFPDLPD